MEINKAFNKVLKFFSLTDRAGNLSITNVAVIVLITKMAVSTFDWPTAAALFMSLLNYSHKRQESAKAEKSTIIEQHLLSMSVQNEKFAQEVQQIKDSVKGDIETINSTQESLVKAAEEVKKFMSAQAVQRGFQAPVRKNQG